MKSSPIRVLFVVPTLSVGGAERIITKLLPAMDPTRFEVSLVCTGEEGELFDHLGSTGIRADALRAGGRRNAHRALFKLSRHVRQVRPDVIISSGAGTTAVARLAGFMNKVSSQILWVHESTEVDGLSRLHRLVDRLLQPFTSSFLGVTASQIDFMSTVRKYPAAKIHIIRSGVDVKNFENSAELDLPAKLGAEQGRSIVAMVARLHPIKDHVTFLSAARIVLDSLPRTQFIIIGDGPERAALEKLCGALEIALNVHFLGTCSDIDRILPAIDVHVLSSHSESLPLAVLEGMACGKPVVCTDVGGTSETVEHGISGFLVPPRDPVLLANHLTTLLSNPVLAEQMGAAGKRRVESDFSLVKSVAEVENFIGELVRPNGKIGAHSTQP